MCGTRRRYTESGLLLLQGRSGRPKLFVQSKSIQGFIALPQLLRSFQVQDLGFSIQEARDTSDPISLGSDSDSEGEAYGLRVDMEVRVRGGRGRGRGVRMIGAG